jgi:hypothetical protein
MTLNHIRVVFSAILVSLGVVAAQGQCVSLLRSQAQISQFPNRPAANVAWTGSSYGVLKVEPQTRSYPIYFALTDSELIQQNSDVLVADNTLNGPIALIWTGTEFGLFYQDVGLQLYLQRIDAHGTPLPPAIPIQPNRAQVSGMEYDIAWNPVLNAYVIVHTIPVTSDRGFYLTTVNIEGAVVSDRVITYLFAIDATPRVAVTANGSMGILWQREDGFWFALHAPSTEPISVQLQAGAPGTRPFLATNGSSFRFVFTYFPGGSAKPELHWVAIDAAGIPVPEKKIVSGTGIDIKAISLIWNGATGEYALVYVDAPSGLGVFPTDTRLRRMTPAGTAITDTEFSPDVTKYDYATRYPVIFNGSAYVGEIDRFKSNVEGSEAYLVRHCPLRLNVRADQGSNVPVGTTVTLRANTFGGFGNYTYFWDFGDLNQTPGPGVITHKYDRLGTYTVSVTVTDAQGSRQTASFNVVVSRPKPRIAKH